MKKALAIFGALLVVALGFLMPHIAAVVQDQALARDVRRIENAAVSLELAQKAAEPQELGLIESLDLFSLACSAEELEEGRHTSAVKAARAATELGVFLPADVFDEELLDDDSSVLPDDVTPFLLSDKYGRSGIYWRCGWEDFPGESVWVDDQNGKIVGFCLRCPDIEGPLNTWNISTLCEFICTWLYTDNLYHTQGVFSSENSQVAGVTLGEDTVIIVLTKVQDMLCFNISSCLFDYEVYFDE